MIKCECGCGKEIEPFDKWGRPHKFICGHSSVGNQHSKGYKHTEESKLKMREARLGKHIPENIRIKIGIAHKGRKLSEEHKRKLSLAKRGRYGAACNRWKGDNVGNKSLHVWVRRRYPKPLRCTFCLEKKPLQLANITGNYNRDLKNWKYLCVKCHVYYDGTVYNLINKNKNW